MSVRRRFPIMLLGATLLAAMIGICQETGFANVSASGMINAHAMIENDCASQPRACATALAGHMRLLSQMLPAILQNVFAALFAFGIFLLLTWIGTRKRRPCAPHAPVTERLRQRLRHLVQPFQISTLVFLFSQGILHPKREA